MGHPEEFCLYAKDSGTPLDGLSRWVQGCFAEMALGAEWRKDSGGPGDSGRAARVQLQLSR